MQTIRRGTIAYQARDPFTRLAHFAVRLCGIIIFLDQADDQVRFTGFLKIIIFSKVENHCNNLELSRRRVLAALSLRWQKWGLDAAG